MKRKTNKSGSRQNIARWVPWAILTIMGFFILTACNDGGGGGLLAGGGIGGTGISIGEISGFGSVIVNDVEFDTGEAEVVVNGVTGFLAETPEQWCEAIETLAGDAALREKMGARGRRRVVADFSVQATFPKMLSALEAILD